MPDITIRIGAARDASLESAFAPLLTAAKRARAMLAQESATGGQAVARGTKRGTDQAEKAFAQLARDAAKWEKQIARDAAKSDADRVKAAEKALRDKQRVAEQEAKSFEKAENDKTRAAEKSAREQTRVAERAARQELHAGEQRRRAEDRAKAKQQKQVERDSRVVNGGALRGQMDPSLNLGRTAGLVAAQVGRTALSYGARATAGAFQGAGVDLSAQSAISKGVSLETAATKVSNSGYMPGQAGPNGQRQDPTALANDVRQVANSTATDTLVAMDALDKFVAKTGDLASGRDMLQQLAVLSKATGADLSDMADAAGDVANNLGDVPNKGAATVDVLRLITAQGKEGAVEIKDLASQMAKVASAASMFEGDKGKNIAEFGALTQFTRARGGAASSTQAATSVTSFQNTFSKGARLKAFKSFGVDVQGANGKNRDAEDVILDSIQAAATKHGGMKNFNENMGDMFKDVRARSVTKGFESTFQDKYSAAQGTEQERITTAIAETRAEFDKLKTSTMDDAQVADSFAAAMKTTESQATILNNRFADTASQLSVALNPAIAEAARIMVPFAQGLSNTLTKLTGADQQKTMGDANSLEVQAAQLGARVRDEMRAGGVKPEDAQAFQTAFAQLQATQGQLGAKTADREQHWSAMDVFDKLTGNGGIRKREISQDQMELSSLQRSIDTLGKTMADLARTGISATPPTGGASPPRVDQSGRTPGVTGAPAR